MSNESNKWRLWGEEILIPACLERYVSIQREFKEQIRETIQQFEENSRFYEVPSDQVVKIREHIGKFTRELLTNLMDEGCYDCTEGDLVENRGNAQLAEVAQAYDNFCVYLKNHQDYSTALSLSQAEKEAASKIQGLGFGIISNSLSAHLIYQVQQKSVIKKQIADANAYFNHAKSQIESNSRRKIEETTKEYYDKVFVPQMKTAIHNAYSDIMIAYIQVLDRIGKLSINEIKDFDYERSQEILNGISRSNDPKKTIIAAMKTCPYNVNIYVTAYKMGLYDFDMTFFCGTVGVYSEFQNIINPKTSEENEVVESLLKKIDENSIKTYNDNWKLRAQGYLSDSLCLVQQYPNNFVGYGLTSAMLIASNLDNRVGNFWGDVNKNVRRCVELYTVDDGSEEKLNTVIDAIGYALCSYVDEAKDCDYLDCDTETSYWHTVASVKRSVIPAIHTAKALIDQLEQNEKVNSAWHISWMKNNLLGFVFWFCNAYDIISFKQGSEITTLYHIPLEERKFAIDLYDILVSEGVDKFSVGYYAFRNPVEKQQKDIWRAEISDKGKRILEGNSSSGCYIATCVYGSYDCPQVWALRRYRDNTLAETWYGRIFIRAYYAISPTLVRWFGSTMCFKKMWKGILDRMVARLKAEGVEDAPYKDKNW